MNSGQALHELHYHNQPVRHAPAAGKFVGLVCWKGLAVPCLVTLPAAMMPARYTSCLVRRVQPDCELKCQLESLLCTPTKHTAPAILHTQAGCRQMLLSPVRCLAAQYRTLAAVLV